MQPEDSLAEIETQDLNLGCIPFYYSFNFFLVRDRYNKCAERITKCLGRFINLLGVKLSFILERAASNEYPLQKFSLKNKK